MDDRRPERAHYLRFPAPWLAGCSDTGLRHADNQDALSLAAKQDERTAVVALADGVTTAEGSEVASAVAVEAAVKYLIAGHQNDYAHNVMFMKAFDEANKAVLAASDTASACTLIAALVTPETITVGNVGDSRAYFVGDDGSARLLSTDDSMAQERMKLGMARDEAERSRQAHAITKWLGHQSTSSAPSLMQLRPTVSGWLLLCSDGLWNYASAPEDMASLFARTLPQASAPDALAEALVAWANEQGGRDNITVIVARFEATNSC